MRHPRFRLRIDPRFRKEFIGGAWAVGGLALLAAAGLGMWLAGAVTAPDFVEMRAGDGWHALRHADPRALTAFGIPVALWALAVTLFHYFDPRRWVTRDIRRGVFQPIRQTLPPATPPTPAAEYVIPIVRRPFHEALAETEPEWSAARRAERERVERRMRRQDREPPPAQASNEEDDEMKLIPLAAAAALGLGACAHPPVSAVVPPAQGGPTDAPAGYERDYDTGQLFKAPEPVKQWPLRFRRHNFEVYCYDTLYCSVLYAGMENGWRAPTRSAASYGPNYQKGWSGGRLGIDNFPAPAELKWQTVDGQWHEASVDIGKLFKDQVIRHNVSREEMADLPDGEYRFDPDILLEINGGTVRVYMRAHIPTKKLQKPGNSYSDFRNDLILVKTYNY